MLLSQSWLTFWSFRRNHSLGIDTPGLYSLERYALETAGLKQHNDTSGQLLLSEAAKTNAICHAALGESLEVANLLLTNNASVNATDGQTEWGDTALIRAAMNAHKRTVT